MMFTGKDHTFAVCAYGESPFLKECVASLKAQTIRSRIVICTATPNRFIAEAAEEARIPVVVHKAAPGIASDWNFAMEQAEGALVTLAHQDDIYEPDYLACVLKALKRAQRPLIAFTDYYEIRGGVRIDSGKSRMLRIKEMMLMPLRSGRMQPLKPVRRRILSFGNPICCPSVTYVKPNIPMPLFRQHFKASLDWEAWERLSGEEGSFVYVHKMLAGHRIHGRSTTTEVIGDSRGRSAEDLAVYRKFWPEGIARLLNHFYSGSQENNRL